MNIIYNHETNRIVDYLMLPAILKTKIDFGQYQKVLDEDYSQFLALIDQLKVKQVLINHCYLTSNDSYFSLRLLEWCDEIPTTLDDFAIKLRTLSEDDILLLLYDFLQNDQSNHPISKNELFELLEIQEFSVEKNWYWARAIQQPKRMISELIELLYWVESIYCPLYDRLEDERERYVKEFDLQKLLDEQPNIHIGNIDDLPFESISLYVLSPIFPMFILTDNQKRKGNILIGLRHSEHWKNKDFDEKKLFDVLKVLSDETRYKVLTMTSRTDLKAKDIAKKLGITSAAVSYHVSKLTEEALLVYEVEKGTTMTRQVINQTLVKQFIEKLNEDLVEVHKE